MVGGGQQGGGGGVGDTGKNGGRGCIKRCVNRVLAGWQKLQWASTTTCMLYILASGSLNRRGEKEMEDEGTWCTDDTAHLGGVSHNNTVNY
jgi:hypothetical protein